MHLAIVCTRPGTHDPVLNGKACNLKKKKKVYVEGS